MTEFDGVVLVEHENKEIYLIGTAHISQHSADLVEKVIREIKPDVVCVELCKSRFETFKNPKVWRNTDILKVLIEGKSYVLLSQLVLASFQKRLAKDLQIESGAEMRSAMRVAEEMGVEIELIDRDVKITLKRAMGSENLLRLVKLCTSLFVAILGANEKLTEADVEKLKGQDVINALLESFSQELPGLKKVLIDERDLYLAAKIAQVEGKRIVVVVGAGHINGIKNNIRSSIDISSLETIPPRRISLHLIGLAISVVIFLMIFGGFSMSGVVAGRQMIYLWVAATSIASSLGAALALAHPLTIMVTFFSAPVTCMVRAATAGAVASVVEALLRKPVVADFETIADDLASLKGIYKNRLSKVFLVMMLTNLGAVVGILIGGLMLYNVLRSV